MSSRPRLHVKAEMRRVSALFLAVTMIAMTVNPGFAVAASADTGNSVHAVTFMTTDEGGILELDKHFAREEKEASPSDAYVATVSDATVSNASASDAEDELEDGEIYNDLDQEAASAETVTVYVRDGESLEDYQIPAYLSENRTRGLLGWVSEDGTEYSLDELTDVEITSNIVFRTLTECYADSAEIPDWYEHIDGTDRYAFTDRNGTEQTRVYSSRNGGSWFEYLDGKLGEAVDTDAEYYSLAPYLFVGAEPDDAAWAKLVEESGVPSGAVQELSGISSYDNYDGTTYDVHHVYIAPESEEIGMSAGAVYERYKFYGYAENDPRAGGEKLGWYDADQNGNVLYYAPAFIFGRVDRFLAASSSARGINEDAAEKTVVVTTYADGDDWIVKIGVQGDFDQAGKTLDGFGRVDGHFASFLLLFNGAGIGVKSNSVGSNGYHVSDRYNQYTTSSSWYYRYYDYWASVEQTSAISNEYATSESGRNIVGKQFCDRIYKEDGYWYIVNPTLDLTGVSVEDTYQQNYDSEDTRYLYGVVSETTVNGEQFEDQTNIGNELARKYTFTMHHNTPGSISTEYELPAGTSLGNYLTNSLTRTGYTFAGWYTAATGGSRCDSSMTMPGNDLTIYAHWTANNYTVRFNPNGGAGRMADEGFVYDQAKALTNNAFSRTGYTFAGWAKSATGTAEYTNGQSVKNLTASANGTITLYAVWTPITYNVRFNSNGGTGQMANQPIVYDKATALTKNSFTRTGYSFAGWSATASGTAAYSDGASVTNLASTAGATVDLYATWSPNRYTVTFNPNGGTGRMAGQTVDYDKDLILTKNSFTRTGYSFAGWSSSASGRVEYTDGAKVRNLSSTGGSIELFAVWTPHSYVVKFNTNGGTGTMAPQDFTYDSNQELSENAFSRIGYEFAGWAASADGDMVYKDKESVTNLASEEGAEVNLFAVWVPNEYTVKYDPNGGMGSMRDQAMVYDQRAELFENGFTRDGYVFQGWAVRAGGDVVYADKDLVRNLTSVNGKVLTFYAVWAANNYTVEFDANGGEGKMDPQKFVYDEAQPLTANAYSKAGYTFAGWSENAGDGDVVYRDQDKVANLTADVDGAVTIYAVWSANNYTVEFDPNGGIGTMRPQRFVYDEAQTLSGNAFIRTGYTFSGWSFGDNQYDDGAVVVNLVAEPDGTASLKAVWTPAMYTVAFDANGGTGTMRPQFHTYDQEQSLTKSAFVKTGYAFTGWATASDAEKATLLDEEDVKNLSAEDGDEVILYAIWGVNTYDIVFAADSLSGSTERTLHLVYQTTLGSAVKALTEKSGGYTFLGWSPVKPNKVYTLDDKVGLDYASEETPVDVGGATYYAVWQVNRYTATFDAGEGKISGADGSSASTTTVDRDYYQELGVLPTPTRDGYDFAGWVDANGNRVTETTRMAARGAKYTAQWTVHSNGGSGNGGNGGGGNDGGGTGSGGSGSGGNGGGGSGSADDGTSETLTAEETTTAAIQPTTVPETTTLAATTGVRNYWIDDGDDGYDEYVNNRGESAEETLAASSEGDEDETTVASEEIDETTTTIYSDTDNVVRTAPPAGGNANEGLVKSLIRRFREMPVVGKVITVGIFIFFIWIVFLLMAMAKRRVDEAEADRKRNQGKKG